MTLKGKRNHSLRHETMMITSCIDKNVSICIRITVNMNLFWIRIRFSPSTEETLCQIAVLEYTFDRIKICILLE